MSTPYIEVREFLIEAFSENPGEFRRRVLIGLTHAESLLSELDESLKPDVQWYRDIMRLLGRNGLLEDKIFLQVLKEEWPRLQTPTALKRNDDATLLTLRELTPQELRDVIKISTTRMGFKPRQTNRVLHSMPPEPQPEDPFQLFSNVLGALYRHGLLNAEFFEALRRTRPALSEQISALEEDYLGAGSVLHGGKLKQPEPHEQTLPGVHTLVVQSDLKPNSQREFRVALFAPGASTPISRSILPIPPAAEMKRLLHNTLDTLSRDRPLRDDILDITATLGAKLMSRELREALAALEDGTALVVALDTSSTLVDGWLMDVPWEAIALNNRFLGERFIMSRHLGTTTQPSTLPKSSLHDATDTNDTNIVGNFRDLRAALRGWDGYLSITSAYELKDYFQGTEGADLLHITCHASAESKLGGVLRFNTELLTPAAIRPDTARSHPLSGRTVVLNMCQSGRHAARSLIGSWPQQLLEYAEVGAVVATSWSIRQQQVAPYLSAFYEKIKDGMPLARALWEARRGLSFNPDTLAYAVYAAPDAHLE